MIVSVLSGYVQSERQVISQNFESEKIIKMLVFFLRQEITIESHKRQQPYIYSSLLMKNSAPNAILVQNEILIKIYQESEACSICVVH